MKRKKFLALALAGVMTAATLTACAPLEDLYDWFFGGGSSSASRGNGTGLDESETLENGIIQWFGLPRANRQKDEAEPMLQEVAKSFDPESWHYNNGNLNGELNDTAKAALDTIAKDKLTETHLYKRTAVDVWEVQPSQTDFDFSENRWLYYDWLERGGVHSDTPTHSSSWEPYSRLKSSIQSTDAFDLYAGTFQKNGKPCLTHPFLEITLPPLRSNRPEGAFLRLWAGAGHSPALPRIHSHQSKDRKGASPWS